MNWINRTNWTPKITMGENHNSGVTMGRVFPPDLCEARKLGALSSQFPGPLEVTSPIEYERRESEETVTRIPVRGQI